MGQELGLALASIYGQYLFHRESEPQLPYGWSAKPNYKTHELKKINHGRKKNKMASASRKKQKKH